VQQRELSKHLARAHRVDRLVAGLAQVHGVFTRLNHVHLVTLLALLEDRLLGHAAHWPHPARRIRHLLGCHRREDGRAAQRLDEQVDQLLGLGLVFVVLLVVVVAVDARLDTAEGSGGY
jgi:DNA-binding helix-hairpin-helix protein with protein kinase domain